MKAIREMASTSHKNPSSSELEDHEPDGAIHSRETDGEIPKNLNVFEFLFSNPFNPRSSIIQRSPSNLTKNHHIPIIPRSRTIFSELSSSSTPSSQCPTESSINWEDLRKNSLIIANSLNNHLNLKPPRFEPNSSHRPASVLSPVIMIHLPNGIPMVLTILGSLAAGLTVTTVNPGLGGVELARIIRISKPAVIFTTLKNDGLRNILSAISKLNERTDYKGFKLKKSLRLKIYVVDNYEDGHHFEKNDRGSGKMVEFDENCWKDLLLTSKDDDSKISGHFKFSEDPEYESMSRIALIFWSSGTSGNPKGVLRSHFSTISSLVSLWHLLLEIDSNEKVAGILPFFHVLGLQNILLFSIISGSTVYILPRYNPRDFLELIRSRKISFVFIVPPIAEFLAETNLLKPLNEDYIKEKRKNDEDFRGGDNKNGEYCYSLDGLKNITCGGAFLSKETIKKVYCKTGVLIRQGYGLSELGVVSQQAPYNFEQDLESNLGSVGEVGYGVEVKIVSKSNDNPSVEEVGGRGTYKTLKRDEEGEILIRSISSMNSYLNDDDDGNSVALDDSKSSGGDSCFDGFGWFETGDLGKLDRFNRLWLTGRSKELFKVKGFQVSPIELENLIIELDDLIESVGIGTLKNSNSTTSKTKSVNKVSTTEEYPRAFIVPKDSNLKRFVKSYGSRTLKDEKEVPERRRKEIDELIEISWQVKDHIEKNCINYKWLKGGILFVDSLPISPSGKLIRRFLNDLNGIEVKLYKNDQEDKSLKKLSLSSKL